MATITTNESKPLITKEEVEYAFSACEIEDFNDGMFHTFRWEHEENYASDLKQHNKNTFTVLEKFVNLRYKYQLQVDKGLSEQLSEEIFWYEKGYPHSCSDD